MTPQQHSEVKDLIERARCQNRAELRDQLIDNLEWAVAEIESLQAALKRRVIQVGDDPPERIYLQLGSDYEKHDKIDWSEVTWCADEIENTDIEYRLVKRKRSKLI